MKPYSIQELAEGFLVDIDAILRGSLYRNKEDCSRKLWVVVGFVKNKTNGRYARDFLEYALDAIEKTPGDIDKPEDVRSIELCWDFGRLWDYYVSDSNNQQKLEEAIRDNLHPEEVQRFCMHRFLEIIVQDQMDEVFHATLAYLFEEYEAQEDPEDEDSDIE